MPHRPHRVLLASLALVLLGVLAVWNWLGDLDARHDALINQPVEGSLNASIAAQPSPTPQPWSGSVLAAVLPRAEGQAIALYGVGSDVVGGAEAPRLLVTGFDEIGGMSWSADDRSLAFAGLRERNWDIYSVNRDGTGLARLTEHPAFEAWPTWSPDGSEIAFVSYRDGGLAIYATPVDTAGAGASTAGTSTGEGAIRRITHADGPTIEPAWSPDGRWIAFAAWRDGAYRIEAVALADGAQHVASVPAVGIDFRAPAWSPNGRELSYVEQRYGLGRLVVQPWAINELVTVAEAASAAGSGPAAGSTGAGEPATGSDPAARPVPDARSNLAEARPSAIADRVSSYGWFPGGQALAVVAADRSERTIEIRGPTGASHERFGPMNQGATSVAWSRGPMPAHLPLLAAEALPHPASADQADGRPGLVRLDDVAVAGDRIHAGLAEDFAAFRAELRAAVGRDFLGTLADSWRPLGFSSSGSAFFSWHKTGRAFDTQMELRGPGGRRDMVLVRDELTGRTMWRMYLRADAQDGSVGRPLTEPGWSFAAGSGDSELAREGGRRAGAVPTGYWVDFTALAESYGWHRIPSLTQGRLDWHRDWEAIEYWHYERRDGLRWFEAARQVYTDEELATQLHPDRLSELSISLQRLARLGFPAIWPPEG
jgi:TolB protein